MAKHALITALMTENVESTYDTLTEWLQNVASSCSVQQRGTSDRDWPTSNLNLQSSNAFQLVMTLILRRFHFFYCKLPFLFYGFGSQMGHKLLMAFKKQATILTTYLFLKPAQGGLSQLSCFIVFLSVGMMYRDSIYQQLSCGRTFSTREWTLARRLHVRTTGTCARLHPRKLPKRGKLCYRWICRTHWNKFKNRSP